MVIHYFSNRKVICASNYLKNKDENVKNVSIYLTFPYLFQSPVRAVYLFSCVFSVCCWVFSLFSSYDQVNKSVNKVQKFVTAGHQVI